MIKRILLLEGHPDLQGAYQKALQRFGYHCDAGLDAVDSYFRFLQACNRDDHLELFFVDCDLPGNCGQQLCRMIREVEAKCPHPLPRLRIVGFTSRPGFAGKDGAVFGMDDVIPKPMGKDALVKATDSAEPQS